MNEDRTAELHAKAIGKKLQDYFTAVTIFILVVICIVDTLLIHIYSQLLILPTNINTLRNDYFDTKRITR